MTTTATTAAVRPAELPFTQSEFERRLGAVRSEMERRSIDALLLSTPENVTYLTGYETIGYSSFLCLIVPAEGEPTLVVREMELDVARGTTWLSRFEIVSDGDDAIARTRETVRGAVGAGARVAVEETAPFLTARTWKALVAAVRADPDADATGIVERSRRVKSSEELEYIRAACRLVEAGMRAAVGAAGAGSTENLVSAAAYEAMVGGGSDFLASDPIVTSGPRATIAHTTFGNRTLVDGDPVLIELGACRRRYFGALMRTVAVGEPAAPYRELQRVVDEALDACIAVIAPGVAAHDVDAACRDAIARGGYGEWFRKRTGYSIGVAFAPDWGEGHIVSLRRGDDTPLEPGMVFHIPPAIRIPGVSVYGASETVLVTGSGHEVLTRFPRDARG
jgi:Xaa-Pro dipeptidase